jgi:uncharacterized membrane protein (DUF2068 family)
LPVPTLPDFGQIGKAVKKYSSRTLKSVAFLYMAFPGAYILFTALLFDMPAQQCVRILLSPSYYVLSLIAVIAGYGLWEMKRWSWYVFLFATILMVYANAVYVSAYGESHHKAAAFIISILIDIGLIFRVGREVRVPYFLPKIRWWESNPRYKLVAAARITREDGTSFEGEILDLSMGGCFLKLKQELNQDEPISIRFEVFGHSVECAGSVVWRTQSAVTHPKGIGLKFSLLPRSQKRTLRAITHRLRKIAAYYRSARYLVNQDDFNQRLEELQNAKLTLRFSRREAK